MKKTALGFIALAMSLMATTVNAYNGAGDIRSINRCDENGKLLSPMASGEYAIAGDKVHFRIRLENVHSGELYTLGLQNKWQIRNLSGDESAKPTVGVYVAGQFREAQIVRVSVPSDVDVANGSTSSEACLKCYTDLVCEYTVQPGDFAFPMTLANSSKGEVSSAGGEKYWLNPEFELRAKLWTGGTIGDENSPYNWVTGTLAFGDNRGVPSSEAGFWEKDFALDQANIRIQTLDFLQKDIQLDEGDAKIVDVVFHGGTNSVGGVAYLKVKNNTNFQLVKTGAANVSVKPMKGPDGVEADYQCLKVEIPAGVSSFQVKVLGTLNGAEGVLYLSSTEAFAEGKSGVHTPNYITANLVCGPAKRRVAVEINPADITLTNGTAKATVVPSADYATALRRLTVKLSTAYTSDVKVKIDASMVSTASASVEPIGKYIALSSVAEDGYLGKEDAVTFTVAEMNRGVLSKDIYVYVLGGDDETAGTGKGILFTPVVEGTASAATYYNETALTSVLMIEKSKPVVLNHADFDDYANGIPGGVEYVVPIRVQDGYNDIGSDYVVTWKRNTTDTRWETAAFVDGVAKPDSDGYLYIKVKYNGGSTYNSKFKVTNASGGYVEFNINNIKVNDANQAFAVVEGAEDEVEFDEIDEEGYETVLNIRFNLNNPHTDTIYAFLVPLDEASSNKVECKAFTTGIAIRGGDVKSVQSVPMTILDGSDDTLPLSFAIELRRGKTLSSDLFEGVYECKDLDLFINNVPPVVNAVEMSGSLPIYKSGDTFTGRASIGLQKVFTLDVIDGMVDWSGNAKAVWTFADPNGFAGTPKTYEGPLCDICVTNQFTVAGTYTCNVKVQDKDMLSGRKYSEIFEFKVVVDPRPSVLIEFPNSNTFNETEADKGTSSFDVVLSTPATSEVVVELANTQIGIDGVLNISQNRVVFAPGETRKSVVIDELDGTANSMSYKGGFEVTATVTTTTLNEDGQPYSTVYMPSKVKMYVANEAPQIVLPLDPGTTNDAAINVNMPIAWKIDDVDADLARNLTVTWSTSEGTMQQFSGANVQEGVFTNIFKTGGAKSVTITVTDKDNGMSSRTLYFKVSPSKAVFVHPYGPYRSGPLTSISKQYAEASGRGEGRVWSEGTPLVVDFEHKYTFGFSDSNARLFAWGYKNGQIDNGTLPSHDIAISKTGDSFDVGATPDESDYYMYSDTNGRDSFFYAWVIASKEEDAVVYTGTPLVAPLDPANGDSFANYNLSLPLESAGDDSNPVFPDRFVEAFFSKEKYVADNMGDMNGDGIPDYFAVKTWTSLDGTLKTLPEAQTGQAIAGSTGKEDSSGQASSSDLANVATYNDDGDFLPAAWGSSNPLNPQTLNWGPGQPFSALKEIRGIGNGLNEPGVSDYELTEAETNALCAACAAAGVAVTDYAAAVNWASSTGWTPEAINPDTGSRLNPLHPDTDGDGFDDGWEYYFWYYSKIGAMVGGKWSRLEGRRFDINAPAEGSMISSDEISKAFDPHVARDVNAEFGIDFDNDGLTDLEEFVLGTNPCDWDSDGDGQSDLWEVLMGLNPCFADIDSNPDSDFMARLEYFGDTFTLYTFGNGDMYVLPTATGSSVEPLESEETVKPFKIEVVGDGAGVYWSETEPITYVLDEKTILASDVECRANLAVDGKDYLGAPSVLKAGIEVTVASSEDGISGVKLPETGFGWFNPETRESASTVKALKVFNYGGDGVTFVPCTSNIISYVEVPLDVEIVDIRKEVKLTLVHDQVYLHEGFDPRVAWNIDANGLLDIRWQKPDSDDEGSFGLAGVPTNTVAYSSHDEYLLLQYRQQRFGNVVASDVLSVLKDNTTYPNLPVSFINVEKLSYKPFTFTNATVTAYWDTLRSSAEGGNYGENSTDVHGADTDGDGVPDGWELYVGYNPNDKVDGGSHIDSDKLSLAQEYAGVDSCNAYTNRYEGTVLVYPEVYSIAKNNPGKEENGTWLNKFFPTDPNNADTDGDGLNDSQERDKWSGTLPVGYNEYPASFSFIYGDNTGKYATDGKTTCFRGGGLNPCSVDTDCDLLPDAWEYEFAGINWTADNHSITAPAALSVADEKALTVGYAYRSKDDTTDHIRGGMDGTVPSDANYDYDNDGLANFQEYLVQALRHLRYDDGLTPLMGRDPSSKKFVRFIPFSAWDGSAFHKKCVENGFTGLGAWQFRSIGYFALPPHSWDPVACSTAGLSGCANYKHSEGAGYRVMLRPSVSHPLLGSIVAGGYASTDPRRIDSDNDGMDDYYELFHGLNPLLGVAANPTEFTGGGLWNWQKYDVIAKIYGGVVNAWKNSWTGFGNSQQPAFDAIQHPWMIGTMECDADGDGLRNDDEALKVNVAKPQNTHTDPTPLWMTDSTSSKFASFTSQYYNPDPYITEVPEYEDGITVADIFNYPQWTDFKWNIIRAFRVYANDKDKVSATEFREGTGGMNRNWMFSFEENEGYDTDGDFRRDISEMKGELDPTSDPLNYMDPNRRQALYLPGKSGGAGSVAVSYDSEFRREVGSEPDMLKQFTAEFWLYPEGFQTNVVLMERVFVYGPSTLSNNLNYIRANFRFGFDRYGKLYGEYEGATIDAGANRVTCRNEIKSDAWTHVALSYDGSTLALYVNGEVSPVDMVLNTTMPPANGIMGILQYPDASTLSQDGYRALPGALIVGARARTANAVSLNAATEWNDFDTDSCFKGWIDEIRVWDGARKADEINADYMKRYTFEDVKANREAVFKMWRTGFTRASTGVAQLPAELLLHYNFVSLPGGVEKHNVLTTPVGFQSAVLDNVRRTNNKDLDSALDVGWWSSLKVKSDVYNDYAYVPWIQNSVAHMPLFDGSSVDSRYWSAYSSGVFSDLQENEYPDSANPYVGYVYRYEKLNRLIQLFEMSQSATNSTVASEILDKYKFQIRSDFVGTSDLLPLGEAFARRSTNFWDKQGAMDAWTVTSADGEDLALIDEIPAWAYNLNLTNKVLYLTALANGLLPDGTTNPAYASTADSNMDGLNDWWQNLHNLKGLATEDSDMDGLADFAEYLISDVFKFAEVSPVLTRTNGKEFDYFLKKGKMYFGEMFSDHDFIEDWWESLYSDSVADTAKYDPSADSDYDGWSNYAECRAGTRPDRTANIMIDYDGYPDYPVPLLHVNVHYAKALQTTASLMMKAYSTSSEADACWTLAGSKESTEAKPLTLGLNPGVKTKFYLGRNVVPGTVGVYAANPMFSDDVYAAKYDAIWFKLLWERPVPGTDIAELTIKHDGETVGTINYESGEGEIDFTLLQRSASVNADKRVVTGVTPGMVTSTYPLDLRTSYFRVEFENLLPASSTPLQYTLWRPTTGHLREGRNRFEVFVDLDGNGDYTLGEPHGFARDVDVKWNSCSFDVELKDNAVALPRIDLGLGSGDQLAASRNTSIRVVRTAIDRVSSSSYGTIVNPEVHNFDIGSRGYVFENDVMELSEFDLDWDKFPVDVLKSSMVTKGYLPVTSVTYRVETVTRSDLVEFTVTNSYEFVRRFTAKQLVPSPVNVGNVNYGARPVFRWKYDTSSTRQTDWDTFTAFSIQISKGSTTVWNSGVRMLPPRLPNGEFEWMAPICVGDLLSSGQVFSGRENYTWQISLHNAKYQSPSWSASQTFRMNVYEDDAVNPTGYGRMGVRVKYFGPGKIDTSLANMSGTVRVEAYATPDFAGEPLGATFVRDGTSLANSESVVNATIIGLEAGVYYVLAYIDSNGNRKRDDFESWGYVCPRGDTVSKSIFVPTPIKIGDGIQAEHTLYIEDTDIDQDCLPDVYEYDAASGKDGFLSVKGPAANSNNGYIAVNPDLSATIGNLVAHNAVAYMLSAGMTSVPSDLVALSLSIDTAENTVEGSTLAIKSISLDGGAVNLIVGAKANEPDLGTLYVKDNTVMVAIVVKYADSLDGDWKEKVFEKTFEISEGCVDGVLTITKEELESQNLDTSRGFFKVGLK